MALTPSAIPFAPPGSPIAGNPDAAVAAESGVAPGGFLGMLGNLAAAPLATIPVLEGQAVMPVDAMAGLTTEETLPDTTIETAGEVAPAKTVVPPEAAAAAMAVMAQMLAGTRAVSQAAPTGLPLQAALSPATPGLLETPPATDVPQATVVTSQTAAAAPAMAVMSAAPIPLATSASRSGAATLAPRPVAAESVDAPSLPQNGSPSADATKTSAFQSLTALLVGTSRGDGTNGAWAAEAPTPAGDAPRSGAAFTTLLATSPLSGDAATADAQQPVLIREPVGTAQWADSIGARLTMMATRGEQQGSLRLSPEHLGPVEVQIRTQDDGKASVWFGAQHADTRAALQDSLPRLRELFAAQGMQLGDAGVSRDPPRQQAAQAGGSSPRFGGGNAEAGPIDELSVALPATSVNRHAGLLDTYA